MNFYNADEWEIVNRPSYFGKNKAKRIKAYNKNHGVDNWQLAWQVGDDLLPFELAIQLYEDAYYEYLKDNEDTLDYLCKNASEVYDNAMTNVMSGFDYTIQENDSNHYQDISVRKAIYRLGRKFEGDGFAIQIRTNSLDEVGKRLSPGFLPFHLPLYISKPVQVGWWGRGTVEEFWQSNKVLIVKKDSTPKLDQFL